MEREKLIKIQFVFRILEFVVNFDNIIRVTCISYTDLVEILNLLLKYKYGRARRTRQQQEDCVMHNSLVTAHSFMSACAFAK